MQHETREHNLAGGARLLTIAIPNAVTYYWSSTFRAGYRFVDTQLYEMPHLAEHLAFEGTKAYPDSIEFKKEIERDGTYYNATTSYDAVSYVYSGAKDGFDRILSIAMSQMYEPLYGAKQIEQEKSVIEQEMSRKQEDDGWRLGYLELARLLPQRNPDIEARIKRIADISQADLRAYHQRFYGVTNTAFVLAGDFSQAEIAKIIDELNGLLQKHPAGKLQPLKKLELKPGGGEVLGFEPYRKQQSLFSLRFILPVEDIEHQAALSVVGALLTGGLSPHLQRKARERGLTYGINAFAGMDRDFTTFMIRSQTSLDKLPALVALAGEELLAICNGEFTDDELKRAIGYRIGGLRRGHQTPAAYAGWYADQFAARRTIESPEQRVVKIAEVDRAAIMVACKKYFTKDNALLTLVGTGLSKHTEAYRNAISSLLQ